MKNYGGPVVNCTCLGMCAGRTYEHDRTTCKHPNAEWDHYIMKCHRCGEHRAQFTKPPEHWDTCCCWECKGLSPDAKQREYTEAQCVEMQKKWEREARMLKFDEQMRREEQERKDRRAERARARA